MVILHCCLIVLKYMQAMFNDVFLSPAIDDKAPALAPITGVAGSSLPPSAIPPMVCDFSIHLCLSGSMFK